MNVKPVVSLTSLQCCRRSCWVYWYISNFLETRWRFLGCS